MPYGSTYLHSVLVYSAGVKYASVISTVHEIQGAIAENGVDIRVKSVQRRLLTTRGS